MGGGDRVAEWGQAIGRCRVMDQVDERKKGRRGRRRIVAGIGVALVVAVMCLTVVTLLPASEEPFFDSPLRSALTGLGLLGVAWPLCIAGWLLRRHAAGSPYFEEGFMAGVLSLFGYIALIIAILCLGLALYALIHRHLAPKPPRSPIVAAWRECGLRCESGQHSGV